MKVLQFITVTDYERVADVKLSHLESFACPKCGGLCKKSARQPSLSYSVFDCLVCGRGFEEMPDSVKTVSDAHKVAEERTI